MNAKRSAQEYENLSRGLNRGGTSIPLRGTPQEIQQVCCNACEMGLHAYSFCKTNVISACSRVCLCRSPQDCLPSPLLPSPAIGFLYLTYEVATRCWPPLEQTFTRTYTMCMYIVRACEDAYMLLQLCLW